MTLTVAALLALLIAPAPARATTTLTRVYTLSASEATWVTSRTPGTSYNSLPYLSATKSQDRAYLRFPLPDGVAKSDIVSATLTVQVVDSTAVTPGLIVSAETGAWSANTLTYANRPNEVGKRLNAVAPVAEKGASLSLALSNATDAVTGNALSVRLSYEAAAIQSTYARTGAGAPVITLTVQQPTPSTPTPTTSPSTPTPTTPPSTPTPTTPSGTSTNTAKPLQGAPAKNTTGKLVFAHYFTPYPLSIDNKPAATDYYARNYLTPSGENGIHAGYGGLLRDRPEPVAPSSSADWRVDNLVKEVQKAKAAGIDGFTLNLMSLSGTNWDAAINLMKAAQRVGGFVIVPMIDASTSIGTATPQSVAASIAQLFSYSSAYRPDGKYLLSSFYAEKNTVSWWSGVTAALKAKGFSVSFQAVFLDASDANMKAFAPVADGFGNWGTRTASNIQKTPNLAAAAAARGKTWMSPVAVQDERPRSYLYAESNNTEALRASWQRAIDDGGKYVQLVTWNDYSENTQFAPSAAHGNTFLALSKRYIDWFHTGKAPAFTTDAAYLTHRIQFAGAAPLLSYKLMTPTLEGTTTKPRDTVEAVVELATPATVLVTSGDTTTSFTANAGQTSFAIPLRVGAVSVKVVRSGVSVIDLRSPYTVVARPQVQDEQYYGVTSWG